MKPNKLIKEKSPYLLQHAYNPVDWYPWSEEAFTKAINEDKPVFLSIGYSTCHWCHVMEKESFEDSEVASIMNEYFINIKVDREERPDIDTVYMSVCQVLTGSGGWPLTVIMTPDKKPFFAGTYFPKTSRYNRIGMLDLLPKINEMWRSKRDDLITSSDKITEALIQSHQSHLGDEINPSIFNRAFRMFKERFDEEYGGFGTAPKFPSPHNLLFLLNYYVRRKDETAKHMVEHTLLNMRLGGIYDHIGFGFHRYSTDKKWLLPHFEKMLYDQAMLVPAYSEMYTINHGQFYKQTVFEVLEYVSSKLTYPEGGFYSAEDADSEGEEGKFYVWHKKEVDDILQADAELICDIFNINDSGNFVDPFKGDSSGENIFYLKKTLEEHSSEKGIAESEVKNKVTIATKRLFEEREKRVHPHKDEKILTDWNGLMIAAYAKAYKVFKEKKFLGAAVKSTRFIIEKMLSESGELLHRYKDGDAAITGTLDDYAFISYGLLELYEADYNPEYLQLALKLTEYQLKHFWDDEYGGFFLTADYAEELIVRPKDIYDGAIPSGNSISFYNLIKLYKITGKPELDEKIKLLSQSFYYQIENSPASHTAFLTALDSLYNETTEVIIVGNRNDETAKAMLGILGENFVPGLSIILLDEKREEVEKIAPYLKNYTFIENKTAAYICKNFTCDLPVTTVEALKEKLGIS